MLYPLSYGGRECVASYRKFGRSTARFLPRHFAMVKRRAFSVPFRTSETSRSRGRRSLGTETTSRASRGAVTALHEHDAGILVVARRDRLARDVMIAGYLEMKVRQAGARIVSVAGEGTGDDSPTDRLMRQMIDAFAEYERQIIAARTRAALQAKKARGERAGNLPWGYRADENGKLVADVDEQLVIARVRDLRDEGVSIRGVVRCLDEEGYRSRVGRPITQGTVWNILCAIRDVA